MLNREGKYVPRTKVVLNIGPLSRFDDGKPDYVLRLRESFRKRKPLISSMSKVDSANDDNAYDTLDHHTLRPAMRETVGDLGIERFVLVVDRGMYSGTNTYAVSAAGNGYIVSKSLRKTDKSERAWAIDPKGYKVVSEKFRHKSRIVRRTVKDESGKTHEIREKVVVTSELAMDDREMKAAASPF